MTKTQRKELLKLWRDKLLERAGGKCERCGKTRYLQGHHIIPRTNPALLFDLENGVILCNRCHIYFAHKDSLGFAAWAKEHRNINYLEKRRWNQSKNDYELIKLYLMQDDMHKNFNVE